MPLTPADYLWVTYRPRAPWPLPPAKPFDAASALEQLTPALKPTKYYPHAWQWAKAHLTPNMPREEANFWAVAMWTPLPKDLKKIDAQALGLEFLQRAVALTPTALQTLVRTYLQNTWRMAVAPEMVLPLRNLFSLGELLDFLLAVTQPNTGQAADTLKTLANGFRQYVLPYLTAAELAQAREQLRPQLTNLQWPTVSIYHEPPLALYLAALVGLPDEMLALTQRWTADQFVPKPPTRITTTPQACVFGLGSAALVESEMRRLQLRLYTPRLMQAWLAHTGAQALDVGLDSILFWVAHNVHAEDLFAAFTQIEAPELVPHVLTLVQTEGGVVAQARAWLDQHPALALPPLVPLALRQDATGELARTFLRKYEQQGHAEALAQHVAALPTTEAAALQAALLPPVALLPLAPLATRKDDTGEVARAFLRKYPVLDDAAAPAWLQAALTDKKELAKTQKLQWANPVLLPPILMGDRQLSTAQVWAVLNELRRFEPAKPLSPFLQALKQHAAPTSLERCALQLFDLWLQNGAPIKEKWALLALGALGGDAAALQLAKYAVVWPKQNQAKRAALALDCLRVIGTDTALTQLNLIGQQQRSGKLPQLAHTALRAVAQARGLSEEQLQDRIVSDAGFDAQGRRVLDFGPRQFAVQLPADLKPVLRDAAGKVRSTLPKPNTKDDAEKVAQAQAEWRLLKKQIQQAAQTQVYRLEQALATDRRWPRADFETYVVHHPLLQHLARLIIWAGYAAASAAGTDDGAADAATSFTPFRVTEDLTFADVHDEALALTHYPEVGVAHPALLAPETVRAWQQLLNDYELVPPFHQLNRAVYTVAATERPATAITRFVGVSVSLNVGMAMLKSMAWQRLSGDQHTKAFPRAGVAAVIEWQIETATTNNTVLVLQRGYFVAGPLPNKTALSEMRPLPLGEIPPVVFSEVLRDLALIASKTKTGD